jgi:hypothetical protein
MGKKAGALLWNRQALEFVPPPEPPLKPPPGTYPMGTPVQIDTGLAQPNTGFGDYSPGEPGLDAVGNVGSRIQVIPMAKPSQWGGVEHSEPYVDPADGKIYVNFLVPLPPEFAVPVTLNVLFWDPHSIVGPGDADKYGFMHEVPQGPPVED